MKEEELNNIEKHLKKLKPIAPSDDFFNSLEKKLSEDISSTTEIEFPKHIKNTTKYIRFFITTAAATIILMTSIFITKNIWMTEKQNTPIVAQTETPFTNIKSEEPIVISKVIDLKNTSNIPSDYQLVSIDKYLDAVEKLPVYKNSAGNYIQPVQYKYIDTYRYANPNGDKTFIEHKPTIKLVNQELNFN